MPRQEAEIIIVGAGASGLLQAHELISDNVIPPHKITVIDRDPRFHPRDSGFSGTTFGGGDGRHVSLHESTVVGSVQSVDLLKTPTAEGGWLAIPQDKLSVREKQWLAEFEAISANPTLLRANAVKLAEINTRGIKLWEKIREDRADLFETAGLESGEDARIPMFYQDEHQLEEDIAVELRHGLAVKRINPNDIEYDYPSLSPAFDSGRLNAGYASEGFAFHVRTFFSNLAEELEKRGVEFRHNTPVESILRKRNGDVLGLRTIGGEVIHAENYVISPGVPSHGLLEGTDIDGKIMGMAGIWEIFEKGAAPPTPKPYKGFEEHLNVTPHNQVDRVFYSGMYAFVGEHDVNNNMAGVRPVFNRFHGMLKDMLDFDFDSSLLEEGICRRPMTPDQLPISSKIRTDTGGILYIIGGNGAAGMVQGPTMAAAVSDEITGERDSIDAAFFKKTDC